MSWTQLLNLAADVEIIIVQLGALVFTFSYGVFFRWRRTHAGRSLMYMFMAFDALILLNMLGRWFGPDYWGRDVLRPLIYSLLVVAIWRLVFVLWSNWHSGSEPLDLESRPRYSASNANAASTKLAPTEGETMSHIDTSPVKVKITRAWTDLAPKLLAFLTGGTAATVIVAALHTYFGYDIDPGLAALIVTVSGSVLGYFVKDKAVIDARAVTPGNVAVITALNTDGSPKA